MRDYLRTHPSEAAAYSTLKHRLAEQFPNDRERYVVGKTDFILSILEQSGSRLKSWIQSGVRIRCNACFWQLALSMRAFNFAVG